MRAATTWRAAGVTTEWHCQTCINDYGVSACTHCETEWNEHEDISLRDQQARLRDETTHLCEDCANLPLVTCHACCVMRDTSDEDAGAPCLDCGIVARCEHTPSMLDVLDIPEDHDTAMASIVDVLNSEPSTMIASVLEGAMA